MVYRRSRCWRRPKWKDFGCSKSWQDRQQPKELPKQRPKRQKLCNLAGRKGKRSNLEKRTKKQNAAKSLEGPKAEAEKESVEQPLAIAKRLHAESPNVAKDTLEHLSLTAGKPVTTSGATGLLSRFAPTPATRVIRGGVPNAGTHMDRFAGQMAHSAGTETRDVARKQRAGCNQARCAFTLEVCVLPNRRRRGAVLGNSCVIWWLCHKGITWAVGAMLVTSAT